MHNLIQQLDPQYIPVFGSNTIAPSKLESVSILINVGINVSFSLQHFETIEVTLIP